MFFRWFLWAPEAVDLFFVLSGFILNYVYLSSNNHRVDWRKYAIARFARIAPLYYLTLLVTPHKLGIFGKVLVMFPRYASWFGFEFIAVTILNLFMLVGVVGGPESFSVNPPSWSISIEVVLYITVFPLLACRARYMSKPFIVAACFGLSVLLFLCYGKHTLFPTKLGGWNWTYLGRGVFGFTMGFLLCSLFRDQKIPNTALSFATRFVLLYVACPVVYLLTVFGRLPGAALLFLFPGVVYYTASDQGLMSRALKLGILQWLGDRSYSLYMWHFPIMAWYDKLPASFVRVESPFKGIANTSAMIGVVLLVSDLSYRFVEMPSRDFIRRWGSGQLKFPCPRKRNAPA